MPHRRSPASGHHLNIAALSFVAGLLFSPALAGAADISSDMGRFPPGTKLVWFNSTGLYFTHIVRGKDAQGYRVEYTPGRSFGGPEVGTYWMDAKGQMLKFEFSDGRKVTYSPHNCGRTLGVCRFTESRPGQRPENKVHNATPTADGFTYTVHDAGTGVFIKEGAVTLNLNGINVAGWFQYVGEEKIELTIVEIRAP